MSLVSTGKIKFGSPYVDGIPDTVWSATLSDGTAAVAKLMPGHDARAAEEAAINENDIEEAIALLDLLEARGKPASDADRLISRSLYRTAVVTFMACIGTKKHQIPERTFTGEQAATLATARQVRDGQIAHNHGALRQAMATAVFERVGSELNFLGVAFTGVEWPYPEDMKPLRAVMETARVEARRRKDVAIQAATAHIQTLAPEAIERLSDPKTKAIGPDRANTSRNQLTTGKAGR